MVKWKTGRNNLTIFQYVLRLLIFPVLFLLLVEDESVLFKLFGVWRDNFWEILSWQYDVLIFQFLKLIQEIL